MKADDVVEVRMSRAEQAYIYIALGLSHGGLGYADTNLFARLRKELDSNRALWKAVYKGTLSYEHAVIERDKARVLHAAIETIFKPKESEQQKKIRELEETINQAKSQIEELKKETN